MNSEAESTNWVISHGQAIRSISGRSRVIHFIEILSVLVPQQGGFWDSPPSVAFSLERHPAVGRLAKSTDLA